MTIRYNLAIKTEHLEQIYHVGAMNGRVWKYSENLLLLWQ